MKSKNNIAIILAAGTSSRMKTLKPKQFLQIENKKLLVKTIEAFEKTEQFETILVSYNLAHSKHIEDLKRDLTNKNILFTIGGKTRHESFALSLEYLSNLKVLDHETKIVTHDAARPFVESKLIQTHLETLDECDVVNTVLPVFDSLIKINDKNEFEKYVDRDKYLFVQTPQSFKWSVLLNQDSNYLEKSKKENYPDLISFLLKSNPKIVNVIGSKSNLKITVEEDL